MPILRPPTWAGPLLLAAMLAAQQDPPVPPTPATPVPAAASVSPQQRLEALQAEQKQMIADYQAKMREIAAQAKEAAAAGKPIAAMPMRPDMAPLVEKAKAAAEQYAGTDDAIGFLVFIARNGADRDAAAWALDCLAGANPDHPAIAEFAPMLGSAPRLMPEAKAKALLDRFAASSNPDVRGWALYAKHRPAIDEAPRDGDAYRTAKAEVTKAAELATNARLKTEIANAIELREKFGVGCTAPEIEGPDLDGVTFKLSDYRGKVVFLDFWGDW